MSLLRSTFMMTLAVLAIPCVSWAQVIHYNTPVQQQYYQPMPVVTSPVVLAPARHRSPFDACKCGHTPGTPGDCDCKHLHCKIQLPHGCKTTVNRPKTPIKCVVYGKIPKSTVSRNCLEKRCDFEYLTDVPEIQCLTEVCTEIGKKSLECLPGCWFSVCVPINECLSESVECKLVQKKMPMELWKRVYKGRAVYDVYVINNPDLNSPYHAGGMPAKWLVVHCGSPQDIKNRFPGAMCADGSSLVQAKEGTKPKATPADVDVKLVIDKAKVQEYVKQATAEIKKKAAGKLEAKEGAKES